jgi:hypothetical protein
MVPKLFSNLNANIRILSLQIELNEDEDNDEVCSFKVALSSRPMHARHDSKGRDDYEFMAYPKATCTKVHARTDRSLPRGCDRYVTGAHHNSVVAGLDPGHWCARFT